MSMRTHWQSIAVAAAAGLAASSGTATALAASSGTAPAAVTVTIGTMSALPQVSGDTLVVFRGGKDASATVSGTVAGAAKGDTATLLAQPFGATGYTPAGAPVTLGSGSAPPYSFAVRPALATSYEVRVRAAAASGHGKVLGTSQPALVYVTASGAITGSRKCTRPVCRIRLHVWVKVPAAAYPTETAKHWYLYSRLRLATRHVPALPKILELNKKATASAARRLHPYEFLVTLRFTFRIGSHAYRWRVNFCTKDSEQADGLGLPGSHGCGDKWIKAAPFYLG